MSLLNEARMPRLKDKIDAQEAERVREELEQADAEKKKVIKKKSKKK